jgi:hypothetical protein
MKRRGMWLVGGALSVAVLVTAVAIPAFSAGDPSSSGLPEVCPDDLRGKTTKIATAKLIIEFNSTDNDIGVHGAFDNHGWSELCVFDPGGRPIAAVDPLSQLNDLTMAGIFFESREPPAEEFSMADLAAAFPEGQYEVQGRSFDGTILLGSALFTHDVPAPPTITSPQLAEDPKGTGQNPVSRNDLAIAWDPVTETVNGGPVAITGYEVIITKEVDDDPHGFSRPTYDVHVPASVSRLSVPAEFLEPNTVYELEVLALEESGNQTISVGFFKTA